MLRAVGNHDAFTGQVNTFHVTIKEAHAVQQLADRVDDMGDVEITRTPFVEHRAKQKKVLPIHPSHFRSRVTRKSLFQLKRRIQATKPAAENDDLVPLVCTHAPAPPFFLIASCTCAATIVRRSYLRRFTVESFRIKQIRSSVPVSMLV